MGIFLPKLEEKYDNLFERLKQSAQISNQENKQENVDLFMEEYFNMLSGPIINQKLMSQIRETDAQSEKQEKPADLEVNDYEMETEAAENELINEKIENSDQESQKQDEEQDIAENNSYGLIDVEESNWDLL